MVGVQPGELGRAPGAHEGRGQHVDDVERLEERRQRAGVPLAVRGEGEVGETGVLATAAPGRLAVAHEHDPSLRLGGGRHAPHCPTPVRG